MLRAILLLSSFVSFLKVQSGTATAAMALQAMDFEIFGRVQGVFFRKFTKEQAEMLELRGWCKNTSHGTVQGHMEGPLDKVQTMMQWLKTTGSPCSKIDKAEFKNQKEITEYSYDNFRIVKD